MKKETKSLKSLLKEEFLPLEESAEGVLRGGFSALSAKAVDNCSCDTASNDCSCDGNEVCIPTSNNCTCGSISGSPELEDNCNCYKTSLPPSTSAPGSTSKPEGTLLGNGLLNFFF